MTKKRKEDIPKTWKGIVYRLIFYRTKEVFLGIILILVVVILALCLDWGWDKNGEFYFKWGKAANIDIKVNKD